MNTFSLNDTNECIKPLQRMLNELFNLDLVVDGNIGKVTQSALDRYQQETEIVERDEFGACYGPITQSKTKPFIDYKYLKEQDFKDAASLLNVDVASIKAFAKTESKEAGFLNNGFPVILFERHKFYKAVLLINGKSVADRYAAQYPDICNEKTGGYLGGKAEVNRLNNASKINTSAALASASWGMFQILGENFSMCGFTSVESFTDSHKENERNQIMAFVNFIKADKSLHQALIKRDWDTVARRYNGPNYLKNNYSVKMANAYKEYVKA